jgi:hypothetical protein
VGNGGPCLSPWWAFQALASGVCGGGGVTAALAFLSLTDPCWLCLFQGSQGLPGFPGARGKPGPLVSTFSQAPPNLGDSLGKQASNSPGVMDSGLAILLQQPWVLQSRA